MRFQGHALVGWFALFCSSLAIVTGLVLYLGSTGAAYSAVSSADLRRVGGEDLNPGMGVQMQYDQSVCDSGHCVDVGEGSVMCDDDGYVLVFGGYEYAGYTEPSCFPGYVYNTNACAGGGTPTSCNDNAYIFYDP